MKLIFKPKKIKQKAKILPIFIPSIRKVTWGHSGLCPWKIPIYNKPAKAYWTQDSDKDGVIDAWDCAPFNKRKQGSQHTDGFIRYKNEAALMADLDKVNTEPRRFKQRRLLEHKRVLRDDQMKYAKYSNKTLKATNEFEDRFKRAGAAQKVLEKYGVGEEENRELDIHHTKNFYKKAYKKELALLHLKDVPESEEEKDAIISRKRKRSEINPNELKGISSEGFVDEDESRALSAMKGIKLEEED